MAGELQPLPQSLTPAQMQQFMAMLNTGPNYFGGTPGNVEPGSGLGAGISSIGQVLGGILNLGTAQSDAGFGREAAGMADPFSSQRGQYQTQLQGYMGANSVNPAAATARSSNAYDMLQGLLKNPGSLTSMPGYQFGLDQALEGVNRGAGASGMLNSGNRLTALQDRGERYAQGWQQQIFQQLLGNVGAANNTDTLGLNAQNQGYNQLAQLSGVTSGSPADAARDFLAGQQNRSNALGAGIGGIANGAGGLASLIQRALSGGGGSGLNLGGLNPDDVYGAGSGWGQDIIGGGGGFNFDNGSWDSIFGDANGSWDFIP